MKITKFKIYSKEYNERFDVSSIDLNLMIATTTDQIIFNIATDDNIKLLESTGLFYVNKKEAYQGDLFKDKHDNLFRIYKVRGGFAMSVLPFKSTLTGSAPWPLDSLSDEQNASWFENNCSYAGNIYENPELVSDLIFEQ